MAKLTHYGEGGEARMVDVTEKEETARTAEARGFVVMKRSVVEAIRWLQRGDAKAVSGGARRGNSRSQIQNSKRGIPGGGDISALGDIPALRKGNPLEVARVAGIAAAKRTAELIPMCHPLRLTHIDVTAALCKNGVELRARVTATARTGVEMEALAAVSVAALTVYDMCKALDKEMEITGVHLVEKIGGRSGHYVRGAQDERSMALPGRGKKGAGRMSTLPRVKNDAGRTRSLRSVQAPASGHGKKSAGRMPAVRKARR
ncbi:MAG: cyclic pyranopterin monophosphate synthase MoaC [Candidatus Acidiferrales bacterium]